MHSGINPEGGSGRIILKSVCATLLTLSTTLGSSATTDTQKLSSEAFSDVVSQYVGNQDFEKAWAAVKERESAVPDDPDLAVVKANLLISAPDAKPRIVIEKFSTGTQQAPPNVRSPVQFSDTETSEPAGYIGEVIPEGRDSAIAQAEQILTEAARKNPNRLDIRMGLSQLHALKEDYQAVYENLKEILEYASQKKYQGLLWAYNAPAEDPEQTLQDSVHQYYSRYTRRTENPDDALALKFAEASTIYFPNDIRGWNNLAAEYSQQNNNDKAIETLLKAHEIDKTDGIVLMNIGQLYFDQENYEAAQRFYQKVVDLNDEEYTEAAKQELQAIKDRKKK